MQRMFDVLFAAIGLVLLSPLLLVLWLIGLWDTGAPMFKQVRVGWRQKAFTLLKFRTMRPGTVSVATHLVDAAAITPYGRFLRKTKLDDCLSY
jgi:lipopolysaccharide/colanic/teichoic acid biosynthesis glycosyltransferase